MSRGPALLVHFHLPLAALAVLATLGAATPRPAGAQWLRSPLVRFEPGVRTVDAISSESNVGSQTGFNLRVVTVLPTAWRRMDLFFGAQFAPFGLGNGGHGDNDPAIFYGASFMLLGADRTGGWLDIALPVMGYYRYDPTGLESVRLFVHDLVVEGALTVHIGPKMLADLGGVWARSSAYLLIDQPITKTVDPITERVDRFRPAFLYGISIPIAGKREEEER